MNDEMSIMHIDHEAARMLGFPSAVGQGYLQWSYLHNTLRNWLGDNARILKVTCQFRAPNIDGQILTVRGVVVAVREHSDDRHVDVDIWIEDEAGSILAPGNATVSMPAG